jgi:hypothetical protein
VVVSPRMRSTMADAECRATGAQSVGRAHVR